MLKLSRTKKNACLALAVAATILGGGSVFAAEHDKAIVEAEYYGDAHRSYWVDQKISNGKGWDNNTYTFTEDTVLKPNASQATYHQDGSLTYNFRGIFKAGDTDSVINMNGHRLDVAMNYDNPGGNRPAYLNLYGIAVTGGHLTIKDVGGMNIAANGSMMTNTSKLSGIYVSGTKNPDDGKAKLTIKNADGWNNAIKFHSTDSGSSEIEYGIYVNKNTGSADLNISGMVNIDLNNSADVVTVRGGKASADDNVVTTAYIGGGLLKSAGRSIYASGGEVYINSQLNSEGNIVATEGNRDVQIQGSAVVQNYNGTTGKLAMALNTADSYFKGTILNNNGNAWMALQNGATWTNQDFGGYNYHGSSLKEFAGGDSAANTGYIFQNDSGALNLGSYSGSTTIFYAHDNAGTETSDYTAGNTTVTTAKAGSNITLVTDNVDTNNDATVKAALNALAGKLYYNGIKNGENALEGTAAIAEGLTSSSKYLKTSSIYFNEENGQGTTTSSGNQTKTSFTTTLTGNNASDTEYAEGGVIAEDGSYKFDKATTISITDANGIDLSKATTITADKTLTINTDITSSATLHALGANTTDGVTINAGKLVINAHSTNGRVEGINVGGQGQQNKDNPMKLTINGDTDMNIRGIGYSLGLYAAGNSEVNFNGNVTAMGDKDNQWGLTSKNGAFGYYGCSLVYSGNNYTLQMGPKVTINGDVNAKIDGNALFANGGHAKLTINGGGNIEINKDNTHTYYAMISESGTTSMNVNLDENYQATSARDNKLILKGNVGVSTGAINANEPELYTYANLGLATKDSEWTGVAQNGFNDEGNISGNKTFFGAINLFLQNGATWNNEKWGATSKPWGGKAFDGSHVANFVGGDSDAAAGNIFQKDENNLTIDKYSGNTNIYYAHTGNGEAAENYAAGDTIIRSAAADSVVSLITDNSNVAMDNADSVANVLNALAGKLTYSNYVNGENNLTGYVKIADGLTASSKAMKSGNITFTDTGKGSYVKKEVVEQSELSTALTGDTVNDIEYEGNIDSEGNYFFTKDSTITIADVENSGAGIDVKNNNVNVKADKGLAVKVTGDTSYAYGISQKAGQNVIINADKLSIDVTNTGRADAIHVAGTTAGERAKLQIKGNVDLKATHDTAKTGGDYTIGAYVIQSDIVFDGDVKSTVESGTGANQYYGATNIYAAGATGSQDSSYKAGSITVNGNVDLSGKGQGVFANIGNAEVTINGGGSIKVDKTAAKDNGYAAIRSEDSTVNMNVNLDANGAAISGRGNDVNIEGNIAASVGAVNDIDTNGKMTTINMALDTAKSTLHGALVNGFDREDGTTGVTTVADADGAGGNFFNGAINLYLQNGAEWNNELWGTLKFFPDDKYKVSFQGSHAANFTGGSDAAHTGYIIQNDDMKLTIDNYSGYTTIFYSHTDNWDMVDDADEADGTEADHYIGGDTIIKKAAKDSNITLVTDNANIDTANNEQVGKVLNALAGKLFYNAYVTGERNLSGTVSIADGLTASSFKQTFNSGDITFSTENGQGSYSDEKPVQTEFTSQIQGTADRDKEYVEAGITTGDQKYTFTKDSTITVGNKDAILGVAEIDADWVTTFSKSFKGITVDAGDNTLTLNTNQRAIYANGNSKSGIVSNITAGKLAITANETNAYRDAAFAVATGGVTLNVNADIEGTAYGTTSNTYGLYAEKGSTLNVNGDITAVKDDGYGIDGKNTSKVYGIRANDGTVTVNGGVNMTVNGTAVAADKGTVSINMNADKSAAADNDVMLTGSVKASNGTVNLGMSTASSKLTGLVDGNVNLWLQNGASWDNTGASSVAKLAGGASEAAAGNIFANGALTIANYSGNTNIYYAHTGNGEAASDYAAGDTTITSAAEGSVVSLITDNSGISMDSEDSVANVLNSLAGKLFYTNFATGENNLTGYVKIADGLTASSKALKAGDITFTENGQGSYVQPGPTIPDHQVTTEFKTTLTGDSDKDQEYLMGGVIAADGTYKFTEASDITAVNAIDAAKDLKIVADKTLSVTADKGYALNVTNAAAKNVDITAEKLVLKTTSSYGAVQAGTANTKATVNINGNVDINASNLQDVYGVYAANADVTVNGNVKAEVTSEQGGYNYSNAAAISSRGGGWRTKYASNVTVNGDVDITANANGLQANGNGAAVTVNGGGAITINDTNSKGYSALRADNGTVNMNVANAEGKATAGLGKDVVLKGNLAATNGAGDSAASIINVALDTEKSSLEGVAYTAGNNSSINLWLQNGASWTNEVHGATEKDWQQKDVFTGSSVANFVGGTSDATAGSIFQKDSNALTIANYSGNTNIYYAHTGNGEAASDYAAGDTVIKSAAEGSVVSLITDSTGVAMDNEYSIKNVLNSLAGKLTYTNFTTGEENLTGYVKIADGLTASSKTMQTGDISFSKDDGKGSLKDGSLTPGIKYPDEQPEDKKDLTQGITGDDEKDYGFKQDGILKADGKFIFTQNPTEIKVTDGAAVSAGIKNIDIDSSKAKLVLTGASEGIKTDGHSVNILGSTEISGETAISANNGDVTLNGITTITGENAAINAANGAKVSISGGAATITGDLNADGASIKLDGGKTTSEIKGDLNVANNGSIDINLNEKNSTLTGGYSVEDGNLNLTIQNGATWNVGSMAGEGLNITGGATQSATGYIVIPYASSAATYSLRAAAPTTSFEIANYSGWETLIYAHENAGADVTDYTGADTVIRKAAAGSGVVLSTDNSGIDMKDKASVEATLKALAQKVTYSDHEANASNLTGKVQIAEGLTASSASKNIGDMTWAADGKGQYVDDSVNWNAIASGEITEGDYETFVMKGVRSAATTSLHTWRDNMQDTYTGADLADADGIFAKALGGKTSSDVKGVKDSNTYSGVQVGYDKALADDTHIGVAFDYRDGDSKYMLGGEGDNKLYSIGVYGVKKFADDSYLRVAAKAGRVENEYDVYTEGQLHKLHGDYKANAYGLTMEYGKTFSKGDNYLTPKAQLTWAQVNGKDYSAYTESGARMDVSQDKYQSFVGRLGLEAGMQNERGRVYAGLYAAHEFAGDITTNYFANDGKGKHTSFSGDNSWMELTVGGSYDLSKVSHVYADFAKDFGGDFERKWKVNAGIRFEF